MPCLAPSGGIPSIHDSSVPAAFVPFTVTLPGAIDAIELGDALRTQGVSVTDAKVATLISVADSDHDGFINFEEFLVVMA